MSCSAVDSESFKMASFRALIGAASSSSSNSGGGGRKQQQQATDDVDFLLKTIDEQNEQLTRLQNKFRGEFEAISSGTQVRLFDS